MAQVSSVKRGVASHVAGSISKVDASPMSASEHPDCGLAVCAWLISQAPGIPRYDIQCIRMDMSSLSNGLPPGPTYKKQIPWDNRCYKHINTIITQAQNGRLICKQLDNSTRLKLKPSKSVAI